MSYCAVNMQKYNAGALGGLQSHNQREHESRKNREIDPTRTHLNYDTVNAGDIQLRARVNERIDDLHLSRAVRKDAVVYCSFIVSSDQEFFRRLGEVEHIRRENRRASVAIGLREPISFDVCDLSHQHECIAAGAESFFRDATRFFQRRFGEKNVINGNVHLDEPGAPHMHLGIVPVIDGRLSAKALFTPESLRQLQTDFAAEVGEKYGLIRGREGSEAKHLDEMTFKLEQRKAELEGVEAVLTTKRNELRNTSYRLEETKEAVEDLEAKEATLETSVEDLLTKEEDLLAKKKDLSEELEDTRRAIEAEYNRGDRLFGSGWQQQIKEANAQRRADRERIAELERKVSLYERFLAWAPEIVKQAWRQFQELIRPDREKKQKKKRDEHVL